MNDLEISRHFSYTKSREDKDFYTSKDLHKFCITAFGFRQSSNILSRTFSEMRYLKQKNGFYLELISEQAKNYFNEKSSTTKRVQHD